MSMSRVSRFYNSHDKSFHKTDCHYRLNLIIIIIITVIIFIITFIITINKTTIVIVILNIINIDIITIFIFIIIIILNIIFTECVKWTRSRNSLLSPSFPLLVCLQGYFGYMARMPAPLFLSASS